MSDNSLLYPPKTYMLELSPASTQCTHGIADSFAGIFDLVDLSKLNPSSTSRLWIGRFQDVLHANSDRCSSENKRRITIVG